jgi:hypothetical protein
MSSKAPSDLSAASTSNSSDINVNAGIDSGFTNNLVHRGSLTPPELDSIHQTNSFKQMKLLEEEDNRELANKAKKLQEANKSTKQ